MTKLRTFLLSATASALIGGLSPLAGALPANEVETTYFKDATFSTEVGYSLLSCNGGHVRSGKTSRYSVRSTTPCRTSGPMGVDCTVDGVPTLCPPTICDSSLFSCS
jgi:hypothetical protein